MNDPYGEKTCSMSKANFQKAATFGVKTLKEDAAAVSQERASARQSRPQTAKPILS